MKLKISVAIATFNEEKNLPDCLESVKDLADEIVVVDGSSTDRTVEVAKKYRAKVIITDNPPIFHINKQKAIDECRGDWILQLDADERVTPLLRSEILKVTSFKSQVPSSKFNGYWIPRKNYFLGRFLTRGGQYPDYTLRLYRRGKGRLPCRSVHEQAVVEGKVGYLKNDLIHIADPNFSRYLLRFDRYTSLIADEMEKKKLPLNLFTFLNYWFWQPLKWFFSTYFRHKGFMDGFPGFVFSGFSSLRFVVGYIKYWERRNVRQKI